jgi:hypothetical protein
VAQETIGFKIRGQGGARPQSDLPSSRMRTLDDFAMQSKGLRTVFQKKMQGAASMVAGERDSPKSFYCVRRSAAPLPLGSLENTSE